MTKQNDDVTFKRPEYIAHEKQIKTVISVYAGIDSARKLIKQTPHENDSDYADRLDSSMLDNFVERIVTTMSGQIFRKPLTYEDIPKNIIDNDFPKIAGKKNLNQFSKDLTELAIRDGKSYILVDIPKAGGDPYFATVERLQLVNWEKDEEGRFTMAVILEGYVKEEGTFAKYESVQYRHIKKDGNVDIYREESGEWKIYDSIKTSYDFVPLYELETGEVPPLYDIAISNINYLNRYSMKDSYLDTAGSPIPFGKNLGLDGENDVLGEDTDVSRPALVLGVNSVILSDNSEASFEWVEMSGQCIDALQNDLDRKAQKMSERAIAIISESTKTATQTNAENSESNSRLSDIAEDDENTLNRAYAGLYKMKRAGNPVGRIIVNRDFNLLQTSGVGSEINQMWLTGLISHDTALKGLIKNEVVDIESIDDEIQKTKEESLPIVEVEE